MQQIQLVVETQILQVTQLTEIEDSLVTKNLCRQYSNLQPFGKKSGDLPSALYGEVKEILDSILRCIRIT